MAPLSGAGVSSGALVQTNNMNKLVYADVMQTQSSFWHRQALISSACDQHLLDSHQFKPIECTRKTYQIHTKSLSDSHQKPIRFTPKAYQIHTKSLSDSHQKHACCRKIISRLINFPTFIDFVTLLWDQEIIHNFGRLTEIAWDLAGLSLLSAGCRWKFHHPSTGAFFWYCTVMRQCHIVLLIIVLINHW